MDDTKCERITSAKHNARELSSTPRTSEAAARTVLDSEDKDQGFWSTPMRQRLRLRRDVVAVGAVLEAADDEAADDEAADDDAAAEAADRFGRSGIARP